MSKPKQNPPETYFVWSVSGKPVSVHLSLSLVGRLEQVVSAPVPVLDGRPEEIGGLLLGRVRQVNTGYSLVSVEAFEPLECEHVRSASWILSRADRRDLERGMQRLSRSRPDGLTVVGWFRTHTRPGLYMDQYDLSLHREYFPDPAMVTLLVRPSTDDGVPQAGFFFWENGDIHRTSSYWQFPLRTQALAPAPHPVVPLQVFNPVETPVAIVPPPPPRGAEGIVVRRHEPQTIAAKAREPESRPRMPAVVHAQKPVPAAAQPPRARWKQAALATPVILGALFGFLWQPEPFRTKRDRRAAAPAAAATDRAVYEAPEVVIEVARVEAPAPPQEPQRPRTRTEPRPVMRQPAPVKRELPKPQFHTEAPPPTVATVFRPEGVPALRFEVGSTLATVSVEQAKVSTLRRAVGSIPGLGFLKRKAKPKGESFVPAKAVRQVRPQSPPTLSEGVPVRVKLMLNDAGKVVDTELLGRNVDLQLGRLALEAAKEWQFEPARVSDHPVETEVVLQFRFGPGGGDL